MKILKKKYNLTLVYVIFFKKEKRKAEVVPQQISVDMKEANFQQLYNHCKPSKMTSTARMYSLYKADNYILQNNIPYDFVECGVWKGGSALLIVKMFADKNIIDRKVILYDSYQGTSEPTEQDKNIVGQPATSLLKESSIKIQDSIWCYSSFKEVKNNLSLSG